MKKTRRAVNKDNDNSWFGDSIHYWSHEALPTTYAIACVKIATKQSKRAGYPTWT